MYEITNEMYADNLTAREVVMLNLAYVPNGSETEGRYTENNLAIAKWANQTREQAKLLDRVLTGELSVSVGDDGQVKLRPTTLGRLVMARVADLEEMVGGDQ